MITVLVSARCVSRCDWTAGPGGWDVDRTAEAHTRKTGHPTATTAIPVRK